MPPAQESINRLLADLRLDTPIIAVSDAEPGPLYEPLVHARGGTCCFAYYERWLKGETLVVERDRGGFDNPQHGCPGGQSALGLADGYPPWMAHFLTDGQGAPMGEGLKATPDLAQAFLDRSQPPEPGGDSVLIGPLKLEGWSAVRSLTFLVDPDRLSALLTLVGFWSDGIETAAPFSSGCGLLWRELLMQERDMAVLGATDIAMRKYLPPEILALTVSPARFERMLGYPDSAFLRRSWWQGLLDSRQKARGPVE
ncbi:MAG: DUF169 domain-containing protein [Deltaproteobacteria bacterium]|nr:DUF169 domain-containing protein [Deltaproteobacteria bacterium]